MIESNSPWITQIGSCPNVAACRGSPPPQTGARALNRAATDRGTPAGALIGRELCGYPRTMPEDQIDRMVAQWSAAEPGLDTQPLQVIGRLLRGAALVEQRLTEALTPLGLSYADFDVINTLRRRADPEGTHPRELARSALITSGAMTARLDRLAQRGLVSRRADTSDRRAIRVRLTAKGQRLATRALQAVLAADEEVLTPLTERQRAALAGDLKRLLLPLDRAD